MQEINQALSCHNHIVAAFAARTTRPPYASTWATRAIERHAEAARFERSPTPTSQGNDSLH
jgi:hypothetical protein